MGNSAIYTKMRYSFHTIWPVEIACGGCYHIVKERKYQSFKMDADVACSIDRQDKVQGISSPALVKKGAEGRILKYSSDYIDFV